MLHSILYDTYDSSPESLSQQRIPVEEAPVETTTWQRPLILRRYFPTDNEWTDIDYVPLLFVLGHQ
jgi:hypothetical protein